MQKTPPSEGFFVLPKPKPMRDYSTLALYNEIVFKRFRYTQIFFDPYEVLSFF
jgi:hypothetical protein